jgi:hypothetical protein
MQSHLQPAPDFQPSPAQRRFVEFVVAHPEFKTVTQFCEAAKVPRSTYEDWSRKPNFRAWFIREWSSALLFEGWHVLNLARASMVNSPVHFQVLAKLIFDPAGQAALMSWAGRAGLAPDDTWQQPQPLAPAVESHLLPAAPEPAAPVPPLRTPPEPNQAVTAEIRKNPPPPSPPAAPKSGALNPTPADIHRVLRNAVLGVGEPGL